jgi:hypothetical protein
MLPVFPMRSAAPLLLAVVNLTLMRVAVKATDVARTWAICAAAMVKVPLLAEMAMETLRVAPAMEMSAPAAGPVHVVPDVPVTMMDDDAAVPKQLMSPPPRLTVEVEALAVMARPSRLEAAGMCRNAPATEYEAPVETAKTVLNGPV